MNLFLASVATQSGALTTLSGFIAFLIFGLAACLLLTGGFKMFDKCTPGDLVGSIIEKGNVASAILASAVIFSIAYIFVGAMG